MPVARRGHLDGIDSAGGTNALLGTAPKTVTCTSPKPPLAPDTGVRRAIPGVTVFDAWLFDWHGVAALTDAELEAYAEGPVLPDKPELVIGEGQTAVYLREHAIRRHVPSPTVMDQWRFDWSKLQQLPASTVDGYLVQARRH